MREYLEIFSANELKSGVLRDRATRAHCGRSQEFVVLDDGNEAGLLSYDDWSQQSLGFIFEIFVLPEFRRQGVGTSLLSYAEDHALRLRCKKVRLKPQNLDQATDRECLIAWYLRKGYIQMPGEPDSMEKCIAVTR